MLRCRDIVEQGEAYLTKELTSWQRVQYRLHLAICRNCRRYLHALQTTRFVSQHIPQQPVDQNRLNALVQMIQQDASNHPD